MAVRHSLPNWWLFLYISNDHWHIDSHLWVYYGSYESAKSVNVQVVISAHLKFIFRKLRLEYCMINQVFRTVPHIFGEEFPAYFYGDLRGNLREIERKLRKCEENLRKFCKHFRENFGKFKNKYEIGSSKKAFKKFGESVGKIRGKIKFKKYWEKLMAAYFQGNWRKIREMEKGKKINENAKKS